MKIMMVAPKFYNNNIDICYWNFYFPLKTLGHDVLFFDTSSFAKTKDFTAEFNRFKPELIFCMPAGDLRLAPYEPLEEIEVITKSGTCNTFAWFSDDVWRFEGWSSELCHKFNWCSTTEPQFEKRFKEEANYENIIIAPWHSNQDFYTMYNNIGRAFDVTFIGTLYGDREETLGYLHENGVNVNVFNGLPFEEMIKALASSRISISFMRNPNADSAIQMKARPFEIAATNTCLLCEENKDMEQYFDKNKEYISFKNKEQLLHIIKNLLDKPQYVIKMADRAEERYLREHTSQHRLSELVSRISL